MDPRTLSPEEQLVWLNRGVDTILPEAELLAKLRRAQSTGRPLRVKLGMDPTAPDLHLGHSVVLRKMQQFQQLGHEVIVIIGDFTARIGDPTGRSETRKPLDTEAIAQNALTYQQQAYRILDAERTRIVYNNDWLGELKFADVVQIMARCTVARLLERDDFSKRYAAGHPIAVHEFAYAFAQAYDSVYLKADVELGGTDQRFNILLGRDLQESYGQEAQVALLMPLLVGTDGVQKMSKSLGNYVGIAEDALTVFSKLMSISDSLMQNYRKLLVAEPDPGWERLVSERPMEAKKQLAAAIAASYNGAEGASAARNEWERIHSARSTPTDVPDVVISDDEFEDSGLVWICRLLSAAGLASSNREARRLVEGGGVSIAGEKAMDPEARISVGEGLLVQVGRRRFVRVRRSG